MPSTQMTSNIKSNVKSTWNGGLVCGHKDMEQHLIKGMLQREHTNNCVYRQMQMNRDFISTKIKGQQSVHKNQTHVFSR